MGLDNGILLKCRKDQFNLPKWLKVTEQLCYNSKGHKTSYVEYELAYWRKCYGIRDDILNQTSCKVGLSTVLSIKDIDAIIKIIFDRYFTLHGIKSWDTNNMYYWGYGFNTIKEGFICLRNLFWVKQFIKSHKRSVDGHLNYRVYFYDSY